MKRHLIGWALALACAVAVPAIAQNTVTGTFTLRRFADFLAALPSAASNISASDRMVISQSGETKGIAPLNYFLSRDAGNVSDAAAARGNLSAAARDLSDATLPDALQNLTLRTPGSCDGYSSETAEMTSASNVLIDNSASFAAGDVGKLVSVNGAGPTQYFNHATIAGGGAGHAVGEEIALTGGTGTAATVIVRSVGGGGDITAVAGKAGSLGSYTAPPSNPVTAGDATLTVTWQHDNLVSTVSVVDGPHQMRLADNASNTVSGALWGYGTDYSSQINTAIATGEKIHLPKGRCGVASTINVDDLQGLVGNGAGGRLTSRSSLMWLGPVGGTVLNLSATGGGPANSLDVGPFNVYALGAASKGVVVKGIIHSTVKITSQDPKDYGFILAEGDNGNQDTFFTDFWIKAVVNHEYSRNAVGLSFPKAVLSSGAHDVNGNNFYNLAVFHYDGNGVDLLEGFMNQFWLSQIFADNSGNGWGVWFGGSSTGNTLRAHDNIFYQLISQGPIMSEGGTWPALGNRILPLDLQAFLTTVTMQAGSTLYCTVTGSTNIDFGGSENYCTPHAYKKVVGGNPAGTATTANYVAMGVGGTFDPKYSGNMDIIASGGMGNDTPGGGALATIFYGTGTPPANGDNIETAGTTRFQCGSFPPLSDTPSGTFKVPFTANCGQTGFSRNTTYWWDVGVKATGVGTAALYNVFSRTTELP